MQVNNNTKLSNTKKNEIIKRLIERFNYDKIINEEFYIKHLSPKMMIKIQILQKDQIFKDLSISIIQQIFKQISFFKVNKTHIKIQYENSDRILIITGIKKDFLNLFVDQWIKDYNYNRRNVIIKQSNFIFWHVIQLQNNQIAFALKKFIRLKKIEKDQIFTSGINKRQEDNYKFANRRVRIIFLNQDFFTILVDLISESNHQKFAHAIQNKGQIPILYKNLMYVPIYMIQRGDQQIQQIDDAASSEMLSRTSQAFDNSNLSRMREIDIQTANQGTQIQVSGIQIQTEGQQIVKQQQKIIQNLKKQENQYVQLKNQIIIQKQPVLNHHSFSNQSKDNYRLNQVNRPTSSSFTEKIKKKSKNKQKINIKVSVQKKPSQKSKPKQQQFPALIKRNSIQGIIPQMPNQIQQAIENASLQKIQFLQMKRRYNQYIRQTQSQGRRQIDIPDYIRKQSQSIIYKRKFYHGVIKKAEQIKINRKISYL